MQVAQKDACIEKLEAGIARRDASIRENAAAVETSRSAIQKLAVKDAEMSDKDEQIAALKARIAQFEQASSAFTVCLQQAPHTSEKPSEKHLQKSLSEIMLKTAVGEIKCCIA
jgi:hypothetical protein